MVKRPPASAGDARDAGSILGSERFPGVGTGNLLQYSCLENSMENSGYSPWGHKESDMNKHSTHTHTHIKAFKSSPLEFYLGEFKGRHCFLGVESATIHLVGRVYQKLMKPILFLLLREQYF